MPFGFLLMGKDFLSLFLSSFVTVMYSLESYEGPALHPFKEFRDVGFRGGRKEMYGNISILAKGNGLKAGHNHNEANSIVFNVNEVQKDLCRKKLFERQKKYTL